MLGDETLFHMPQCRDSLMDRIANAYFKRDQKVAAFCREEEDNSQYWNGHSPASNAGQRLYKNALRLHEKKKALLNESLNKVVEEELQECSFQPGLNSSSAFLDRDREVRERIPTHDLLYGLSKQPKKKLENLRIMIDSKEVEEVRQKPEINIM